MEVEHPDAGVEDRHNPSEGILAAALVEASVDAVDVTYAAAVVPSLDMLLVAGAAHNSEGAIGLVVMVTVVPASRGHAGRSKWGGPFDEPFVDQDVLASGDLVVPLTVETYCKDVEFVERKRNVVQGMVGLLPDSIVEPEVVVLVDVDSSSVPAKPSVHLEIRVA